MLFMFSFLVLGAFCLYGNSQSPDMDGIYTANYFPAHIAGFPRVILSPHNVPAISTTNTRVLAFPTHIATFDINSFYQ